MSFYRIDCYLISDHNLDSRLRARSDLRLFFWISVWEWDRHPIWKKILRLPILNWMLIWNQIEILSISSSWMDCYMVSYLQANSLFVRLPHKCKATSYVRQPHLFLGCFRPPKVTSSVVRLHHSCEAAPPVVKLF